MEADARAGDTFVPRHIAGHDAVSRKCLVRQKGRMTTAIEAFWTLTKTATGAPFEIAAGD
jgi:hypothetical protein